MSLPEPILDYAKPTTPNHGVDYQVTVETFDGGCRFIGPDKTLSVRLASILVLAGAAGAAIVAVILIARWLLGGDLVAGQILVLFSTAIALGVGGYYHLKQKAKPLVVEVRAHEIRAFNLPNIWPKTRRWKLTRIRRLTVMRRGISLRGRPVGQLMICGRFHQTSLLPTLEIAELNELASRIQAITGVKVTKLGIFRLI